MQKDSLKKLLRIKTFLVESMVNGGTPKSIPISKYTFTDIENSLYQLVQESLTANNEEKFNQLSYAVTDLEMNKNISYKEAVYLINRILQIENSSFEVEDDVELNSYRELMKRMQKFEVELSNVKQNPKLEEKLAKIQKDLKELHDASEKEKAKEQKDMLKDYRKAKKKVFVIMPFASAFEDVWKGGIERACDKEGVGYMRVDKVSLSSWITKDIIDFIEMADFVIADITGNNPNVMFEFGWSLALKKKPIVIRDENDSERLPFDVKDIRHIRYTNSWNGIEKLYKDICSFLSSTSSESERDK